MNGYKMMSDSYKILMREGIIDKDTANKAILIYDFLSTCDEDDLCRIVDSTAFNDIISAYLVVAARNAGLDDEKFNEINEQLYLLFKEKKAFDVLIIAEEKNNE